MSVEYGAQAFREHTQLVVDAGVPVVPPAKAAQFYGMSSATREATFPFRMRMLRLASQSQGPAPTPHELRRLEGLNNLDLYLGNRIEGESWLTPQQGNVLSAIQGFLERDGKTGYVVQPREYGTPDMYANLIQAISAKKTLVVVPSSPMVSADTPQQLQERVTASVGRVYSDAKEFDASIVVTTYESLSRHFGADFKPEDFDLVILDGVEEETPLGKPTIDAFAQYAPVIGFTSAPERSRTRGVYQLLEETIHEISIREGILNGGMAGVSIYLAKVDVDISQVSITNGDYDPQQLEKALNTEPMKQAAVQLYDQEFQNESGIMNCAGVDHAEALVKTINERYADKAQPYAAVISSRQTEEQNNAILQAYREGKIKVLCGDTSGILNRGIINNKITSFVFNLVPTTSVVQETRNGEMPLEKNGDKHSRVVTFWYTDRRLKQVFFSNIVGDAVVYPPDSSLGQRGEDVTQPKPDIILEGLQVIVDPVKVMTITRETEATAEGNIFFAPMTAATLKSFIASSVSNQDFADRVGTYREFAQERNLSSEFDLLMDELQTALASRRPKTQNLDSIIVPSVLVRRMITEDLMLRMGLVESNPFSLEHTIEQIVSQNLIADLVARKSRFPLVYQTFEQLNTMGKFIRDDRRNNRTSTARVVPFMSLIEALKERLKVVNDIGLQSQVPVKANRDAILKQKNYVDDILGDLSNTRKLQFRQIQQMMVDHPEQVLQALNVQYIMQADLYRQLPKTYEEALNRYNTAAEFIASNLFFNGNFSFRVMPVYSAILDEATNVVYRKVQTDALSPVREMLPLLQQQIYHVASNALQGKEFPKQTSIRTINAIVRQIEQEVFPLLPEGDLITNDDRFFVGSLYRRVKKCLELQDTVIEQIKRQAVIDPMAIEEILQVIEAGGNPIETKMGRHIQTFTGGGLVNPRRYRDLISADIPMP